jgi:acetyl esterase/lipase
MHDAPRQSHKIIEGLEYVKRGGQALVGDLYMPADDTNVPCLVAVHGGAWQRGQRANYRHIGRYLADRGIGLFAISYRFAPRDRYPAAVHDARDGVRFLRAKGASLGVDPARIGIMGDSAGGHLAALVALAGDHPEFTATAEDAYPGVSAKVKVCVPVYGVYDMLAQWDADRALAPSVSGSEVFIGVSPVEDRFAYHRASPINYVTKAAAHTAFLLCWGARDDVVDPATQSEAFLTALKRADIMVRTCVVDGPHFWLSDPLDEPGSFSGFVAPRLTRFLRERL